jgi:hypothetical protein
VPKTKDLADDVYRGISRKEPVEVTIEVIVPQEEEAIDDAPTQEEQPEPPGWDKEF